MHQRPIDNAFAYDCLKRAYPEISSMSKERIDYGLNLLQKGLKVTGNNAVIYAGIANAYMQYANIGFEAESNLSQDVIENNLNQLIEMGYLGKKRKNDVEYYFCSI